MIPPAEAQRILRIRAAFQASGIPTRPGHHVAGPQVTVYRLAVPPPAMGTALRKTTAIEAAIDTPGVALSQLGAWLEVHVPRTDRQVVRLSALGPALGVTPAGAPIAPSLDNATPHAVVGAQSGGGKTELLRTWAILESRQPNTRLVLIDCEGRSWQPFIGTGHTVAVDGAAADAALTWAAGRLDQAPDGQRVVVMIDEAQMLSSRAQGLVREIAERGRKHAVHLVLATQYIRQDVLDRRITSNAPLRLAGRVQDATASKLILGHPGAERLLGKGDMLVAVGGQPPERMQAALPTDADWRRIHSVEQVEMPVVAAAQHPGHAPRLELEPMIEWALENGPDEEDVASATAIRRWFGVGTPTAMKVRDLAREQTRTPTPLHRERVRPALRVLSRAVGA